METAVNELTTNIPEKVTSELIYFIYRGSLSEQTRKPLEKAHQFTNRARDPNIEERLRFLHSCLYKERLREQCGGGQSGSTRTMATSKASTTSVEQTQKGYRCRTCLTNYHSFKDCDRVKARQRCFRCGELVI